MQFENYITMKKTYRVKTHIPRDGKLLLKRLPFQAGETVEVTVRATKHPLRGKYRGRGLMKAFLAGKKREKEL